MDTKTADIATSRQEAIEKARREKKEDRRRRVSSEVRRRARLRAACQQSEKVREVALDVCESDPVQFINDWLWTYDPRHSGKGMPTKLPFVLRPKQRELIRWLQEREESETNGLIEKSRDEGMTFVVLAYMLHGWLFRDGFSAGVGSRKEKLVDNIGDPDALFPKLRYMLYELPAWMLPEGFNRHEHDNYLRLRNPENEATITGEGGDNIGRGGRKTLYFVDEWAFVEHPRTVNAALSQNTNVTIKGSTPNGVGNQFYVDRFSGRMDVFTLSWRDNPVKNYTATYVDESGELQTIYPWYEKIKDEEDSLTVSQEIDISYTASAANIVIKAKWVQAAVDINLEPGSTNTSGLDVSGEGKDKTTYANRKGGVVTRLKIIKEDNPAHEASEAERLTKEDGASVLNYDRLGVGSGMTATLKNKEEELPFEVVGIANSESPTDNVLDDKPDTPASERFKYYADELWWMLRLRFERTWKRLEGTEYYPDDECISIPNNSALIAQLSQPTYKKLSTEKIKVDKNGDGGSSPDEAESVMYAFARQRHVEDDWSGAQGIGGYNR